MKQKVQPKVNEEYLKAYYDNEANANRHMSFANTFGAVIMAVIWTLYLTGAFEVHAAILPIINVVFPLGIAVLLTPLLYVFLFKDKVRKPRYKYFVLFSFILVIAALNVIIPKHTMIAWALPLIMANHYYNPKVGRTVFVTTLIMMPLCMYAAMFVGEYDPNLIGNGLIVNGEIVYPDGAQARFD